MGPEYSIKAIFSQARQFAPCYLVFEDLDSLVSDSVRSYFLNEVDGLKDNDGIFMIGSTNHLERLDPGISVRFPLVFISPCYFLAGSMSADNRCRNGPPASTASTCSPTPAFRNAWRTAISGRPSSAITSR
jgi:hypothetical protein